MKRNSFKKLASILSAAVICSGCAFAFAGCTTKYPEVTITYNFNGTDYAVSYKLSRYDAPKTVQHFIEVADTGFYDGLCIHDYDNNYLYTGGYTIEDGTIVEKDYFTAMKKAEENGTKLTQTVWAKLSDIDENSPVYDTTAEADMVPLYTVYGEFKENGNITQNGADYVHEFGALAMFYTNKEKDSTRVTTVRNSSKEYNYDAYYSYNSATSLFYTFTGSSNASRDDNYCVFGKVTDDGSKKLQELVEAINDFKNDLEEETSFTESIHLNASTYLQYDPIENVRKSGLDKDYNTPVNKPITVKSVKVTKY